jgi:hypothetical protein
VRRQRDETRTSRSRCPPPRADGNRPVRDRGRHRERPADYTATSGTLTFTPGQTTKTVTVPIVGDTLDEADETFTLALTSPTNATIADGVGLGTITDDDPLPTLSVNNVTVTEGDAGNVNATFTVSLDQASGRAAPSSATADGTATAPADYAAASDATTCSGQTTQQVKARPRRHARRSERDVTLNLSNAACGDRRRQ